QYAVEGRKCPFYCLLCAACCPFIRNLWDLSSEFAAADVDQCARDVSGQVRRKKTDQLRDLFCLPPMPQCQRVQQSVLLCDRQLSKMVQLRGDHAGP